jgi:hypothetical protein
MRFTSRLITLYVVSGVLDEVPPPGSGLVTLIHDQPIEDTYVASTVAVSLDALTNEVGNGVELSCTTEPATKFDPFTVIVKEGEPVCANAGEIEIKEGVGLYGLPFTVTVVTDVLFAKLGSPSGALTKAVFVRMPGADKMTLI